MHPVSLYEESAQRFLARPNLSGRDGPTLRGYLHTYIPPYLTSPHLTSPTRRLRENLTGIHNNWYNFPVPPPVPPHCNPKKTSSSQFTNKSKSNTPATSWSFRFLFRPKQESCLITLGGCAVRDSGTYSVETAVCTVPALCCRCTIMCATWVIARHACTMYALCKVCKVCMQVHNALTQAFFSDRRG